MEIILKENVKGLGYKNDIVTVKNGYGRNYLLPQKKAVIASASAKKVLAENLKQRAHKLAKILEEAKTLAEQLAQVETLIVPMKVSPTGTIYGSVTNVQIAELLANKGFNIDRKTITVPSVKEVGEYTATINLHKEVSAEVTFKVEAEEA